MPGEPAKSEMSALKTGEFLTGAGNPFLTTIPSSRKQWKDAFDHGAKLPQRRV